MIVFLFMFFVFYCFLLFAIHIRFFCLHCWLDFDFVCMYVTSNCYALNNTQHKPRMIFLEGYSTFMVVLKSVTVGIAVTWFT